MGLIYLDSCILIYACENHSVYGPSVQAALRREGAESFAISFLSEMECLVKPIKTTNLVLQQYYEQTFGSLTLLPMPEVVFLQAAQLRAHFGLKTPDALHLASAQHHRCDALWTNDERLAQASRGLARNVLKQEV